MGGDGGSIPKRGDVVRTAGYKFVRNLGGMGYAPNTQIHSNDDKLSKNEVRNLRWSRCAISEEPLRKPIAACKLGQLYNKETVLSCLLKKSLPSHAQHIKSLKDIKELKNNAFNLLTGHITCPVSLTDFEGGVKAYIIWACGCALSEKALKNVKDPELEQLCINCGTPYKIHEKVPLLPDHKELAYQVESLKRQKGIDLESKKNSTKRKLDSLKQTEITKKIKI